jgi:hypothetical protein
MKIATEVTEATEKYLSLIALCALRRLTVFIML